MVHVPLSANHPGDADLQAELDAIAGMSLDDLRVRFRRLTRKAASPGLPFRAGCCSALSRIECRLQSSVILMPRQCAISTGLPMTMRRAGREVLPTGGAHQSSGVLIRLVLQQFRIGFAREPSSFANMMASCTR